MRKIAVANRKGVVGKTTTAVNLAHGLALAKKKVLRIDTDTQGHCSRFLGVKWYVKEETLKAFIKPDASVKSDL